MKLNLICIFNQTPVFWPVWAYWRIWGLFKTADSGGSVWEMDNEVRLGRLQLRPLCSSAQGCPAPRADARAEALALLWPLNIYSLQFSLVFPLGSGGGEGNRCSSEDFLELFQVSFSSGRFWLVSAFLSPPGGIHGTEEPAARPGLTGACSWPGLEDSFLTNL